MSPVALDITMSLDGFVTAPNDGPVAGSVTTANTCTIGSSAGRGHTERFTRNGAAPRESTEGARRAEAG